jgi:hypothetical protein
MALESNIIDLSVWSLDKAETFFEGVLLLKSVVVLTSFGDRGLTEKSFTEKLKKQKST